MREPKVGDIWSYWWGEGNNPQREHFLILRTDVEAHGRAAVLSLYDGKRDHMIFEDMYRAYWRFEA